MSYVGTGDVVADKQSGNQVDFLATWLSFKKNLGDQLGIFRDLNGGILTLNGKVCPMINTTILSAIADWLSRVATKAISVVGVAGKPTGDMTSALNTFKSAVANIKSQSSFANTFGDRLPLPITTDFFTACDDFARAMSLTQWASMNAETKIQMFKDALNQTPGGGLLAPFLDLPGMISTALKVLVYGGVALGAFWLYRKVT